MRIKLSRTLQRLSSHTQACKSKTRACSAAFRSIAANQRCQRALGIGDTLKPTTSLASLAPEMSTCPIVCVHVWL